MRKKLNLTQTKGKKIGISDQKKIRGGYVQQMCTCGCCGSYSTVINGGANDSGGLSSSCPPV